MGCDVARYLAWAEASLSGAESEDSTPAEYSPGPVQLLIWTSQLFYITLSAAQQAMQIVGTLALGPGTWALWRLLLNAGPWWSLPAPLSISTNR